MSGHLARIRGQDPVDLALTAVALALAVVVECGLRVLRLPRLSLLLGVPLDTSAQREVTRADPVIVPRWARRRLRCARRAMRHWPFGDSCLRLALVGGCLLRRLDPVLRIGVAKHDGQVRAHAWLEVGGVSLDVDSADFAPVESIRS